jgi:hypothetical protein
MITPVPFSVPSLPFHSQELLARARQYRAAAVPMVDIENGRPNWPKYTLLFHAIELALKAAIVSFGERGLPNPAGPQPGNHDLIALYQYAVANGLLQRQTVLDDLQHLSELHIIHYARYPQVPARPVALISQYDDLVDQILIDVGDCFKGSALRQT